MKETERPIAVVDAYSSGRDLPAALRRHGRPVVHVRSSSATSSFFANRAGDGNEFAHELVFDGDRASLLARLRELGARVVTAGAESGVILANLLASDLGMPNLDGPADLCRDKWLMIERLRGAGAAVPMSTSVDDPDFDVGGWMAERELTSVVVKPVLSGGSDGVHLCRTVEAARRAIRSELYRTNVLGEINRAVLVQELVEGPEYAVNAVTFEGRHVVANVWRYAKTVVEGHPAYEYAETVDPDVDAVAREMMAQALAWLDVLGLRRGPSHLELFMSASGPVFVECASRMPGALHPTFERLTVGRAMSDLVADALCSPPDTMIHDRVHQPVRQAGLTVFIRCPWDGVVGSEEAWDEVRNLGTFVDLDLRVPPGHQVDRTVDLATSPGLLYLAGQRSTCVDDHRWFTEATQGSLFERRVEGSIEAVGSGRR